MNSTIFNELRAAELSTTTEEFNLSEDEALTEDQMNMLFEIYNATKNNGPHPLAMVTICIHALIALIGIFANFIVICVTIVGNSRQESSSITYVTNLSISNFVFLMTVPFKLVEDYYLRWTLGDVICQLVTFIKYLNFSVVALFLMVMSIDRHLAVNRALSASHLRSKRASAYACLFVWLLSLAGALPLALLSSAKDGPRCNPKFPDHHSFNLTEYLNEDSNQTKETSGDVCKYRRNSVSYSVWTLCNFFYSYFIPFLVIISCYCAIIKRVRHPTGIVNAKGRLHRVIKRKVTQMAVILVISYVVCYTPYYVWQVCKLFGIPVPHYRTCFHVERFNTTMAYINSALHPILYACSSGQFNTQLLQAKNKLFCNYSRRYHAGYIGHRRKTTGFSTSYNGSKKDELTTRNLISGRAQSSNSSNEREASFTYSGCATTY